MRLVRAERPLLRDRVAGAWFCYRPAGGAVTLLCDPSPDAATRPTADVETAAQLQPAQIQDNTEAAPEAVADTAAAGACDRFTPASALGMGGCKTSGALYPAGESMRSHGSDAEDELCFDVNVAPFNNPVQAGLPSVVHTGHPMALPAGGSARGPLDF